MSQICMIICDKSSLIRDSTRKAIELIFQDVKGADTSLLYAIKCEEVKSFLERRGDVADLIIASTELYYILKKSIGFSDKIRFIFYTNENVLIEKAANEGIMKPNISIFDSRLFGNELQLVLQLKRAFQKIGYLK